MPRAWACLICLKRNKAARVAGTVGNEETVEDEVREAHLVYHNSPLENAVNLEAIAEPNITMIPMAAIRKGGCGEHAPKQGAQVRSYCRNQTRADGGWV